MKCKVKDTEYIRHFFDGSPDYEQVKNVTIGKTYYILARDCFGDVEDYHFIDDIGQKQILGAYFFEEVE